MNIVATYRDQQQQAQRDLFHTTNYTARAREDDKRKVLKMLGLDEGVLL